MPNALHTSDLIGKGQTRPATRRWSDKDNSSEKSKRPWRSSLKKKKVVHHHDVNENLDESLAGLNVVDVSDRDTTLEKALEDTQTIKFKDLSKGLSRLSLEDAQTRQNLIDVLAKSLAAKTISLDEVIEQLRADVDDGKLIASLVTETLVLVLAKMVDAVLFTAYVQSAKTDVLFVICGDELEGAALEKALTDKGLLCLMPVPDLSEEITSMLADGISPAEILAHVNKVVGETIGCSTLATAVLTHVLEKVYTKDPDYDVIKTHADLLIRILCVPADFAMQTTSVFTAQEAWVKAGAPKKGALALFTALFDAGIISAEAFMEWKEDTGRFKKNKVKALLQVNSWLLEFEPKEEYYSEEEEGDEEDEYLQNPNRNY